MARDYRRLSSRARHLIHRLRRTKHAAVQNVAAHELAAEIHRNRWGRAPKTASPDLGPAGHWRPLNHRAKRVLTQLRRTKVWSVQRRLVRELIAEMAKGRRTLADRIAGARRRLSWRPRRGWAATASTWKEARPAPEARTRTEHGPGRTVPARVPDAPLPSKAPRTQDDRDREWLKNQVGRLDRDADGARTRGRPKYASLLDREAAQHRATLGRMDGETPEPDRARGDAHAPVAPTKRAAREESERLDHQQRILDGEIPPMPEKVPARARPRG